MANPAGGSLWQIRIGISVLLSLLLGFLAWGIYRPEPHPERLIAAEDPPLPVALDWQAQDLDPSLPHLARLTLEHYFELGGLPNLTDPNLQIQLNGSSLLVFLSRSAAKKSNGDVGARWFPRRRI
ncbi:MAG: hypothetical protein HC921_08465 [Synechococcaceae cyanobacterium SM2_3_1]|nr:hypothetical protein [Synechococcaceae cyanobacterium SM2_3_1]